MNLGRDGFGILQMVGLANMTLKQTKADLVVIAFIVDDLDRARVWKTTLDIDGAERTLLSMKPGPLTNATVTSTSTTDAVVVYPSITTQWCEAQVAGSEGEDRILLGLTEYCKRLVPENFTEEFSSFTTSFTLNRIRYGDPFHSVRKLPRVRRIDFDDYHRDEEFMDDVRGLMNQSVAVLMIMLPWYPELKEERFILTPARKALFESLNTVTRGRVVSAFDYMELPAENLEEMFIMPDDMHPTKLGAQRYAQAIVRAIQARWNLKSTFAPKQAVTRSTTSGKADIASHQNRLR
jgi:hypothetical protein